MLSPELRRRLLVESAGRPFAYSRRHTVDQLFQRQARLTPDSPAVTYADTTLDYRQLATAADALAGRLRGAGVRRGDLVPLVLDDCVELPLSMLALMRLGAPFVPMDPAWPPERLAVLLDALRPPVVLTRTGAPPAPAVPHPPGRLHPPAVPHLVVRHDEIDPGDTLEEAPAGTLTGTPPAEVDDVIYGFYTSGSTGAPKCALNAHLGLLNRFRYMSRRFGTRPVVLQNSRHVFDSSIWQLLWPLTNGGQVVIPHRSGLLDLSRTLDTIQRYRVTMTDFVPSIFNTMVDLLAAEPALISKLASLRRLLIGGEQINPAAVHRFRQLAPHVGITNTYGPTEASIGSIFHDVRAEDGGSIPIGRPIDNTAAVVLDERMELVPPGVTGHLYIAGDCVGYGYLNDPRRTATGFVPNPFPEIPGARLYRTGDLAQVRRDGLLHFVGREDEQVKVGGVRVELAEVEAALAGHPAVRAAKVVVRGDGAGACLVAFVVTGDAGVDPRALREHARNVLPTEIVPARIQRLDRLPLNPNGKVDLRRLRELANGPAAGVAEAGPGGREPASSAGSVAALWRELLGPADLSPDTDFFDSGGNSLLAQKLALMLAERTARRVTFRDVVRHPTIRQQVALVAGQARYDPAAALAQLRGDVGLDRAVVPPAGQPAQPGRVLLTGGTGFVGAHLLAELLQTPGITVTCLVRADDRAAARDRITHALRHYGLYRPGLRDRWDTVAADLARPQLGLSDPQFAALAGSVDAIVHSGAKVNMVLGYGGHRAVNVGGTAAMLALMAQGRAKRLHLISSLSVLAGPAADSTADPEPAVPDLDAVPGDGYSQSKWVVEQNVAIARSRGLAVTVYRLGDVMPHSVTGIPSAAGSLPECLLRCLVKLGMRWRTGVSSDFTPVDYVARFLATAVRHGAESAAYHVLGPTEVRLDDLLDRLGRRFELRPVPFHAFWEALRRAGREHPGDADVTRLLALLSDLVADAPSEEAVRAGLAARFTDGARTGHAPRAGRFRAAHGLAWPDVRRAVVDGYAGQASRLGQLAVR